MEREGLFRENYQKCYAVYFAQLHRFICKFVRDVDRAEEIAQDVFLKLFERGISIDPEVETTESFLHTVARNRALDYLRQQRNEEKRLRRVALEEAAIDARLYRDVESAYIEGEVLSTMRDAIDKLPQRVREALLKKALLRMRSKDVAREMNVSVCMVGKLARDARRQVLQRLRSAYGLKGDESVG